MTHYPKPYLIYQDQKKGVVNLKEKIHLQKKLSEKEIDELVKGFKDPFARAYLKALLTFDPKKPPKPRKLY